MTEIRYEIELLSVGEESFSLEELAEIAGLHPSMVEKFVEFGVIEPVKVFESGARFDLNSLKRLGMAFRLRYHLGVNLAGASIIIDLVEKLTALQRENKKLRNQL